jgi:hypothetical protein
MRRLTLALVGALALAVLLGVPPSVSACPA